MSEYRTKISNLYGVSPRLVLDGGFYVAAAGNLPQVTFFAGLTYGVSDLYHRRHNAHP